jgi:competence protein ComEC
MWSTHLFDGWPFLSFRIPTPPGAVVAGYFLFLLLLLLPDRFRKFRLASLAAFIGFLALLVFYPFPSSSKNLKVTFIDVGQGDSILVEFPGSRKMLVDGGGFPTGTFDVGETVVSRFLWNKGIKKIDYLMLTHAHPDHFYGLISVARNFFIGEFWEAFSPADDGKYTELKKALGEAPHRRVFTGFSRKEGDVRLEVIYPPEGSTVTAPADNDRSLVLKITYGSTAVLLTADIEAKAEREILDGSADLRSGVLKSPHHGSSTSSSEALLRAVAPQTIVISVGRGNRYGFPQPEILDRYKKSGARIYRTDLDGAVEIASDGRRLSARTAVAH